MSLDERTEHARDALMDLSLREVIAAVYAQDRLRGYDLDDVLFEHCQESITTLQWIPEPS